MSEQTIRPLSGYEQVTEKVGAQIAAHLSARRTGGPDLKSADLGLIDGLRDELPADLIELWKLDAAREWDRTNGQIEARPKRPPWIPPGMFSPPQQKPANDQGPPKTAEAPEVSEKPNRAGRLAEKVAAFKFHPSDLAREEKPLTHEEKQRELDKLADMRGSDPILYAEKHKELAKRLCTTVAAIDKAVRIVLQNRADDGEQSQTTKLVAIGVGEGVQLWHAPDGFGYATIWINGHWENHRLDHTGFGQWLRAEYGRLNVCKVGDQFIPQASGAQALRDAVATLEGIARFKREERPQPAFRVGGDTKTIWLDLGRPDWSAVEITAEGWWVREKAGVSFLRTDQVLPLPKPVRGGSINALRGVLNVRPSQFVLAVAWLLQALNPVGDYPIADAEGPSEAGKSAACKKLLRSIHPTKTELRKAKKVDDLLIAERNDWALGFDNMSYMSWEWSDTLCMDLNRHFLRNEGPLHQRRRTRLPCTAAGYLQRHSK
jgi:hypothetical protein